MDSLITQIIEINKLSKDILTELAKKNPSFEEVRSIMINRQKHINVFSLDLKTNNIETIDFNNKQILKSYFDEFLIINESTKEVISDVLNRNKKSLNNAKKQRKAEDVYKFLVKPDISYLNKI